MKSLTRYFRNIRYECVVIALVLVITGCYYLSHLTVSGLWYDEGIEYFYSKYMVGSLPIGGYWTNMYRRVCFTMQPPLYNVLMYFWLLVFDTEFTFRLAGVLTTFIGALGFYCGLRKITGWKWGVFGLVVYLSLASIVYYAMECAEYNLLLCMESWMVYFFICCVFDETRHERKRSVIGFYAFATLSVYSQYGAAFLIAALFIALFCVYVKRRDAMAIKWLLGFGFITLLIAIVPLWLLFIQKQMVLQGSSSVDHNPVYVNNFGYSFVMSLVNCISWIFNFEGVKGGVMTVIINMIVLLFGVSTAFVVIRKKTSGTLKACLLACLMCWSLFFFASAYSYYAYNGYLSTYGCENIINGTRYILFFAPLILLTLLIGIYSFYMNYVINRYYRIISQFIGISILFLFYIRMWTHEINVKDDVRETTSTWIKACGYRHHTLVQEYAAGPFYFYFSHSPIFNKETADKIIMTYMEIRKNDTKTMAAYLESLGTFSFPELYYVGNRTCPGSPKNLYILTETFKEKGYNVRTIGEEKNSVVLHFAKE